MSCDEFESMIALAVGGDLDAAAYGHLEQHLRCCERCRRFAAEMQRSQRAVGLLADAPIDPEMLAGIRAGVRRRIESADLRPAPRLFPGIAPRRLALAAGWILALGTTLLLRPPWQQTPPPRESDPIATGRDLHGDSSPAPAQTARRQPTVTDPTPPDTERRPGPPAEAIVEEPPAVEMAAAVLAPAAALPAAWRPEPSRTLPPTLPPLPAQTGTGRLDTGADATEPMVIKLISEEADLVIYWLVQPPEETPKEKTDAISAV